MVITREAAGGCVSPWWRWWRWWRWRWWRWCQEWMLPLACTRSYCAFKSNKIYKYFQTQTQSTIHQNIFPNVYIWKIMRSSNCFLINEVATTKKIFSPATRWLLSISKHWHQYLDCSNEQLSAGRHKEIIYCCHQFTISRWQIYTWYCDEYTSRI